MNEIIGACIGDKSVQGQGQVYSYEAYLFLNAFAPGSDGSVMRTNEPAATAPYFYVLCIYFQFAVLYSAV